MDHLQNPENACGAEFDQMFVTRMIKHPRGAIAMTRTEKTDPTNEAVVQLAGEIDEAQTSEITTMKDRLN